MFESEVRDYWTNLWSQVPKEWRDHARLCVRDEDDWYIGGYLSCLIGSGPEPGSAVHERSPRAVDAWREGYADALGDLGHTS